jgi:hypothetical protein
MPEVGVLADGGTDLVVRLGSGPRKRLVRALRRLTAASAGREEKRA